MKTPRVWLVIGGIAVVLGAAIWFAANNKQAMPPYPQPGATTTTEPMAAPTTAGSYISYSPDVFASTTGHRWLFFHAGWCPQCRALEKSIQENGVPDGVTIFKVNYDTENDLKKKYGVTLQTTLVAVDEQGKEIRKFVAYNDPTIQAVRNALGN